MNMRMENYEEDKKQTELAEALAAYRHYLVSQEKSANTIEKYLRDVKRFLRSVKTLKPDREMVLAYKEKLKEQYMVSSANSMLMAINHYLKVTIQNHPYSKMKSG